MDKMKQFFVDYFKNFTIKKKIGLGVVAVAVVAVIVTIVLTQLFKEKVPEQVSGTYTIEVVTEGGKNLEGIELHIFTDNTRQDLLNVVRTDENGKASFEADNAVGAVVVPKGIPAGYKVSEYYEIQGLDTTITLEIELLSVENLSDVTFKLGDVFADMSVTAMDGKEYKISELLQEKQVVVLNFWYLTCEPCRMEFPYLEAAYEKYHDKVEVLAVNPVNTTSNDTTKIAEYQSVNGLTFPMAQCDAVWEKLMNLTAYPTTVVIDRYGTIGMIHKGSVSEESIFINMFEYFLAENYKQTTVKNVEELVSETEENGTPEAPFTAEGTEFEVTLDAGQILYYNMYKVDGMELTIENPDAYVIYNEKTYKAENGVVKLILSTPDTYTPTMIGIGNAGVEKKNLHVKVDFVGGSMNKPFELTEGETNISVPAGKEQGIFYLYRAAVDGTVTITCKAASQGIEYLFSLYNLNTSILHNTTEDGVQDADGNLSVSVYANAGDEIQFCVGTLPDSNNEYPAGEFSFLTAFAAGGNNGNTQVEVVDYTITVLDTAKNPISGATVTISGVGAETIQKLTDASGKAMVSMKAGNYTVVITAPHDYNTDNTEYKLTSTEKNLTVKLKKKTTAQKTYKVKVVDEAGAAIKDAYVTIGGEYAYTPANGTVSFTLKEGNYTAMASKDGYNSSGKSFGSSYEVTITLKKDTPDPDANKKDYTVTVVDYNGNSMTGMGVTIYKNGIVVAGGEVNSGGKYTKKLEPGEYTFEVEAGDKYGYDKIQTTLTENTPSAIVTVGNRLDMSKTEILQETYVVVKAGLGGNFAEYQSNVDNYFMFTPSASGKYRIRTINTGAKIAYCGTSSYVFPPTYEGNTYEFEVREDQIGNIDFVFSITGISEGVFVMERYAEADKDFVWKDYKGTCGTPSSSFPKPAGTLTYVDVTKSSETYNLVKGSDGYYHMNSASGPIVYVNLGNSAPYISIREMRTTSNLQNMEKGERYNNLVDKYIATIDEQTGVCPLTDDLKYMIQNGGDDRGWWDKNKEGGYYLFGSKDVNKDIAWMFACCYVE